MGAEPFHLEWLSSTESTNTEILNRAREGAPAWTVVAAESQSHGRGRLSRSWHSPAGEGLYFSILLRPHLSFDLLSLITLAAAVALCRGVEAVCGISLAIKWPNDLLLDQRKLGGILTETELAAGADRPVVIVGIGINVTTPKAHLPSPDTGQATSLLINTGKRYSRRELLGAVVREMQAVMAALEQGDRKGVLAQWRARDGLLGRTLTWVSTTGDRVTGEAMGIDDNGRYQVRDRTGTCHEVLSGDLTLARGL